MSDRAAKLPKHTTYMTELLGPLPFCPGCGHEQVVRSLNKALVKLQIDPAKVVIVTDIGCIGLTCRHFLTNAFHGLHGRSITYACGLKLARPDLTVITLMGDGACGIGGTHLLNVARRNIGITLLVANNFNYGMTGGQHSVTTPTAGITSTTPWGNVEAPMDLCATVVAAGGAWVHRATGFDKDLSEVIAAAIEQPGFAMLDIWEICTAYYMPRNDLKKKEMFALMDSLGYERGQQVDKPRPEYSAHYRQCYEAGKSVLKRKLPIEPTHPAELDRQTGIIIAGSAGQKIKSTATAFAEGAISAGLQATQKDDYPITVQTGHSVAEIILSPTRIVYTGIDVPDYIVLVSENGLKRISDKISKAPETCTVYADETLDVPLSRARVVKLPLAKLAKQVSKMSVATGALGALLADTNIYPWDALTQTILNVQRPKIADLNTRALALGAKLVGESA